MMGLGELLILAIGVSMDALAVAICKGLSIQKLKLRQALIVGVWFGVFQALMPTIGWLLGSAFSDLITSVDHWVVFVLLAIIGGNMIRESLHKGDDEDDVNPSLAFGAMLVLAIATSIDALAVGVSLALLNVNIVATVLSIGLCTFIISTIGVKVGNVFGMKFKSKAEFLGGAVLILIGLKILLEHLGVINF